MPNALATISTDDERLRITTWTFDDGEGTGHHRHEYDYVVVPVSGGTFNRSGRTAVFVEVALKR